ncbi:hypothetical protein PBY51_016507 [Eleginops maclovinus]|uniref:Uncharacterized protein n=1 Tax=Eleginops maclovinus TaxID=56733 RepID=A0AAN8AME2_ELEMC|nr:hypothetical protein PBY51_016507 [Eleginops maclovinus]
MKSYNYKHKSGFQKRKQKEELEKERNKLTKIGLFFQIIPQEREIEIELEQESVPEATVGSSSSLANASPSPSRNSNGEGGYLEERDSEAPAASSVACADISGTNSNREDENMEEREIISVSTFHEYPTDMGHFPESLDSNVKRYIVSMGSCKPTVPFPRDREQDNGCFTTAYYVCKTKSGLELPWTWLCYSPQLNVAYCEPCWLFATLTWKTNNWQNVWRRIHQHETSTAKSCMCGI